MNTDHASTLAQVSVLELASELHAPMSCSLLKIHSNVHLVCTMWVIVLTCAEDDHADST